MTFFPVAAVAFGFAALVSFGMALMVIRNGAHKVSLRSLAAVLFLAGLGFAVQSATVATTSESLQIRLNAGVELARSLTVWAGLAFAMNWPHPPARLPRPFRSLATFLAIGTAVHYALAWFFTNYSNPPYSATIYGVGTLALSYRALFSPAVVAVMILRARRAVENDQRLGLLYVAAAFAVLGVYIAARDVWNLADEFSDASGYWEYLGVSLFGFVARAAILAIAALIIVMSKRRTTTFLLGGVALAGALDTLIGLIGQQFDLREPLLQVRYTMWASAPLISSLFVAYVVMRGHLPDLDAKFRFGISRSAIAAIFLAVFFIVSEAAQEFFGDTFNSAYFGIIAAGLLVFAIAPLSRWADRIAEQALPPETRDGTKTDQAYLAALRAAHRDGALTRREDVHLAEVAEALGIGPVRAIELRQRAEKEQGGGE